MGELNTNSSNNVEAVTSLTNAATIRKLLRKPGRSGKSNFEILEVRSISDLANGHNCEVTIRVDLAFGHTGLPIPENERYSKRTETVRRIDLKEVAELAGLTLNDKNQYVGTVTDVESVATLLKANIGEEDITIAPIQDVFWIRAKAESVGFIGGLTVAASGAPVIVVPTSIAATLSAAQVDVGSKVTATVVVDPANAADKTYTVVSSNPAIATVNANGTEITGVAAGDVTITYTSVAAPTVKVEKALNVKSLPVVKPATIEAIWGDLNTLAIGDKFTPTVTVLPADAVDKTYTLYSENTAAIDVVNGEYVVVGYGPTELQVIANGDTAVKSVTAVTVSAPVDPNKDASYESKVTFELGFGANPGEFHAGYVNVGDMVNLIIRPVNLVEAQPVTLSLSNPNASIELDTDHTLTPGVDLVVPMIINGSTTTDPVSIYVNIGGQPVGMSMGFYIKDPAVVPTTATFASVPNNIPAGNNFGSSVTLDVGLNEYIVREAVWTSSHPDDVSFTPFSATNPLSMDVHLGEGLAVGTVVKLTCVVDGVTAVSDDITIIETTPDLESIVFETFETIQENGNRLPLRVLSKARPL